MNYLKSIFLISSLSVLMFSCNKNECGDGVPHHIEVWNKSFETTFDENSQLIKVHNYTPGGSNAWGEYGPVDKTVEFYRFQDSVQISYTTLNGSLSYNVVFTLLLDDQGRCIESVNNGNAEIRRFYYTEDGYLKRIDSHYLGQVDTLLTLEYQDGDLTNAKTLTEEYQYQYGAADNTAPYSFQFRLIDEWAPFLNCFGKINAHKAVSCDQRYLSSDQWAHFELFEDYDGCDQITRYQNLFQADYGFEY